MYKEFFGLRHSPFSVNPDPRFLFRTRETEEALAALTYGIQNRLGFILLTGEAGTGKTTLLNKLLHGLREDKVSTAFVFNSSLNAAEFLDFMMADFGIKYESPMKSQALLGLNQWLLERHWANKTAVLVVDEAQNLSMHVLEEIRMLTNLETYTQKLLQIVLSGQPELEDKLRQPRLRQLRQRIGLHAKTRPLDLEETRGYVTERLRVAAGGEIEPIFTPDAIESIHRYSRGIARLTNLLCDRALIRACVLKQKSVRAETIDQVARQPELDMLDAPVQPVHRGEDRGDRPVSMSSVVSNGLDTEKRGNQVVTPETAPAEGLQDQHKEAEGDLNAEEPGPEVAAKDLSTTHSGGNAARAISLPPAIPPVPSPEATAPAWSETASTVIGPSIRSAATEATGPQRASEVRDTPLLKPEGPKQLSPALDGPQPGRAAPSVHVIHPVKTQAPKAVSVVWIVLALALLGGVAGALYLSPHRFQGHAADKNSPTGSGAVEASPKTTPAATANPSAELPTSVVQPVPSAIAARVPDNPAPSEPPEPRQGSEVKAATPQGIKPSEVNNPAKRTPPKTEPSTGPQVGRLEVSSNIPGAVISIDGRTDAGWLTPHTFSSLPSGTHGVVVSKEGYEEKYERVTVKPGAQNAVKAQLKVASGLINIVTNPPGLEVSIDDHPAAPSPVEATVEVGEHTYTIKYPGFQDYHGRVTVRNGSVITRRIDFNGKG